jgi:hypothetical protein
VFIINCVGHFVLRCGFNNGGCKTNVSGGPRGEAVSSTQDRALSLNLPNVTEQAGLPSGSTTVLAARSTLWNRSLPALPFWTRTATVISTSIFHNHKELDKCKGKIKEPLKQRLYLNDGKGRYKLATNVFGDSETAYGISAAVGDYDNDGDADLYICCYGKNTMYRNRGDGTFEDVNAACRNRGSRYVHECSVF